RHLGGGADGETLILSDRGGKFVFFLSERRLKIDFEAAILEDLHGSRRQRIRNKHLRHDLSHAAFGKAAFASAKAHSSQGMRASRSPRSTVAPHQIRKPGGASR